MQEMFAKASSHDTAVSASQPRVVGSSFMAAASRRHSS